MDRNPFSSATPALLLTAIVISAVLNAQTSTPGPGPVTSTSPIVFYHLTYLYDNLATTVAQRNAADPDLAASRLQGARNFFGLSNDGYQRLGTVLSSAKVRMEALLGTQTKLAAGLTNGTAAASANATLQDLYNQQTTLLQGLPAALQAQLSTADWTALQAFISRELVPNIHVGVINNARPK
jgi:hypothetical protein